MRPRSVLPAIALLALIGPRAGADTGGGAGPHVEIPRLARPPRLEAFLSMAPDGDVERTMARVEGLVQQIPNDGEAASQPTDVYLGYDGTDLYAVFVAFDDRADRIRANLTRREDFFGDDLVEIMLDTFNDRRRAYAFVANPLGVQWDAIWTEGKEFDSSFDTLWRSEGRLTERGYVVLMAIPFRSLRFPAAGSQGWGVIFVRDIPRNNESSFWPRVSSRIEGRLNQAGLLRGLENISPGRNLQFIPFVSARSFRTLDPDAPGGPRFLEDRGDGDAGLDAKLVFRDALVLDLTANPDFSEVESDSPQVTVNQRFEVFFPEKRPFFLENSDYFQTPVNLMFTRRIVEPRAGARLTGKSGPWNLGVLLIDDESPPENIGNGTPPGDGRARFGIARLSRDVLGQSRVGLMVTDRDLDGGFNRVAGADGRFKLNPNWTATAQAATSRTGTKEGERSSGPAYSLSFDRAGRELDSHIHYMEYGEGFETQTGFVPRTDIRDLHQKTEIRFWSGDGRLVSWGPSIFAGRIADHAGTRLDQRVSPALSWEFRRQTSFGAYYEARLERLRPVDFTGLAEPVDFAPRLTGAWLDTKFADAFNLKVNLSGGTVVNFVPPAGEVPHEAGVTNAEVLVTWRPTGRLRLDETWFLTRLSDRADGGRIFANQIARTRLSYQFSRSLTLRAILQYESTHADPARTSLETVRNLNGDLLLTYLVNPWTALFAGVSSNHQNLRLEEGPAGTVLMRSEDDYLNDARQIFVKFSYLFRP